MLRMAHRILTEKSIDRVIRCCRPEEAESNRQGVVMAGLMLNMGAQVIIADNVAACIIEEEGDGVRLTKEKRWSQFPPCPPPFQNFFVEFNYPEQIARREGSILLQGGIMIYAHGVKDAEDDPSGTMQKTLAQFPDLGWMYSLWIFGTDRRGDLMLNFYRELVLDKNAVPIGSRGMALFGDPDNTRSCFEEDVACRTLAYMQCQNAKRLDVTKEEGPSPKWCRRQRVPEIKYQALDIDPNVGTSRRGPRKTDGDRSGKALHICRGHFVHYVDDGVSKGLFGKGIYGTFWIPSHTRGSRKQGKVITTYTVKVPEK